MPSLMIEKAARAILAKVPLGYGMTHPEAVEYVRAVLLAFREADGGMKRAGADHTWPDGYDRNGSHAADKYVEYFGR